MQIDLSFSQAAIVMPREYSALKFIVVGAGGTGSYAAPAIARLIFAKYLTDERVMHYWDGEGELVKGFAPVLAVPQAWDVYLLYDQNAEWNDTPPKPGFWQEQLGMIRRNTIGWRQT